MLAYVYWHVAPQEADTGEYERALLRFSRALADAESPGFLGNASYVIGETPWLGEPGYEDWIWLEGSWALDPLNERAVSGSMERPHDTIAQMTRHGGYGALYYLVFGEHEVLRDSRVSWVTRPRGVRWRDALPQIAASAGAKATVWRRQMVLGPASEFAVVAPMTTAALRLPEGWSALPVDRRRLG